MTETVRLSAEGTMILVHSEGPPSVHEMKRTLEQIVELRRQHGIDDILVDSRARSGQPSVIDIYEGGEMLASTLGGGTRVAVLVSEIAPGHRFFENVAFNRGSTVAYFQDYAEALRWLAQSSKRQRQAE